MAADRFSLGLLTSPECPSPLAFSISSVWDDRGMRKECLYGVPLAAQFTTAVVLSVHALALGKWAIEQFL